MRSLAIGVLLGLVGHALALPAIKIRGDPAASATALATRLLGASDASKFVFEAMAPQMRNGEPVDTYQIAAGDGGKIVIRGNSGVSCAAGLNHYLKYFLNSTFSWGGDQVSIPASLPAPQATITKQRQTKLAYAWNVCTAGYTGTSWNATRALREVDFQALQGISFPLSFTGQEWVWNRVFAGMGMNESGLEAYFSGPHFLPWQRMGNIRGWGGPLDDDWMEGQRELQAAVVARQLELGMIPVLPAFAGHVPAELARLFPTHSFEQNSPWGGFSANYTDDYLLDPLDPLFQTVGKQFLEALLQGLNLSKADVSDAGFNADTFNEMEPRSSNLSYLAACNRAIYESIAQVLPNATFVMQAWLFHESFWTPQRTQAYLSSVPDQGMVLLDLNTEAAPVWTKYDSFYGKPWIWNALHNYGGRRGMYGNLSVLATSMVNDRPEHSPGSTMVGIGYTPEAIETNPVYYELAVEMAWREKALSTQFFDRETTPKKAITTSKVAGETRAGGERTVSEDRSGGGGESSGADDRSGGGASSVEEQRAPNTPSTSSPSTSPPTSPSTTPPPSSSPDPMDAITSVSGWLDAYARRRYGADSASARAAWQLLREAGYQYNWGWGKWSVVEYSPALGMKVDQTFGATAYVQALRKLVEAGKSGEGGLDVASATYRYDLVDLTRQVLSNSLVDVHQLSTVAYQRFQMKNENSSSSFFPLADLFLDGIGAMDSLLGTNEFLLFGQWVNDALRAPNTNTDEERALRMFNAKNQVTLWGPNGEINDYAAKQWAGLVADYYGATRWNFFLSGLKEAVSTGVHFDFDKYEQELLQREQAWGRANTTYPENPTGSTMQQVDAILARFVNAPEAVSSQFQTLNNTDRPGGDLLDPAWTTDPDQLMIICATDPACIGFNSNGYLKGTQAGAPVASPATFYLKKT